MAPYEALYGRPCRSPLGWTEVGESSTTGPDLITDTSEKVSLIRQRLLMAQSRQKSYANVRRRHLEFDVSDRVFLKMMPKRGVISSASAESYRRGLLDLSRNSRGYAPLSTS